METPSGTTNATENAADVANMLVKMKQQQEVIDNLQKQITEKDERLSSAVAEKRKEMQGFMEVSAPARRMHHAQR